MPYTRPVTPTGLSTWWAHTHRNPPSQEAGVDYYCPIGTPVVAGADGRVVDVGGSIYAATGRYLTIDLNDGRRVRYLHLSRWMKSVGDPVRQGAVVGYSGASGYGSEYFGASSMATFPWGDTGGPHVHTTLWPSQRYTFGTSAGTLDFEVYVDASLAGSDSTDFPLEDDMPTMQEFLNTPAYTGGPTISEFFKAVDQGGVAVQVWNRVVDRGLDANGNPQFVPAIQELADAKTLALQILGKPVGEVSVDFDEAAIVQSILAALNGRLVSLSDEDVKRLASAAADEADRRTRKRLG